MGWGTRAGIRSRLLGNLIDSVLWASHCPVAVTRLLTSPATIKQILVPIENLTHQAVQPVKFARMLASANDGSVTLLHICDRSSPSKIEWMKSQLSLMVSKLGVKGQVAIKITPHDSIVGAIAAAAKNYDLVVLRSLQKRTNTGSLAISDVNAQLVTAISSSIVMLGEPQPLANAIISVQSPSRKAIS